MYKNYNFLCLVTMFSTNNGDEEVFSPLLLFGSDNSPPSPNRSKYCKITITILSKLLQTGMFVRNCDP